MSGMTRTTKASPERKGASALVLALALFLPASGAEVRVTLDTEAQVRMWATPELPEALPSAGAEFHGREFTLSVPENIAKGWLIIYDIKRGNIAYTPWDGIATSWNIKNSDWRIAEVEVHASFEGRPVAGLAILKSKKEEFSRLLANGSAIFFGIPAGEVSVVVRYVRDQEERETIPQRFELALQRAEVRPVLAVTLSEAPDGAAVGASGGRGESTKEMQPQSNARKSLPILVALVVGVAALIGLYYFLKQHEDRVAESLRRLGVKLPSEPLSTSTSSDVSDQPSGVPFQSSSPIEPITEGIDPVAPGAAHPVGALQASSYRLVGDTVTLDLPGEGEFLVGREASCDLPLADATVSRQHATLIFRNGTLSIRDESSTNGTYLNGVRLEPNTEHPLQPGDKLQLGRVKFRVEES